MFCIVRVGSQIYDTALVSPVDRNCTDVTFNDVLLFRLVLKNNNFVLFLIFDFLDTRPSFSPGKEIDYFSV